MDGLWVLCDDTNNPISAKEEKAVTSPSGGGGVISTDKLNRGNNQTSWHLQHAFNQSWVLSFVNFSMSEKSRCLFNS